MSHQVPVVDDTLVWDAWLAMYRVPALSVALELDIFESLDAQPDSPEGLAQRRFGGVDVFLAHDALSSGWLAASGGFSAS